MYKMNSIIRKNLLQNKFARHDLSTYSVICNLEALSKKHGKKKVHSIKK